MALALGLSVAPHAAARDAVPPPPLICPPGYEGVTSHAGPKCEQKAPKSCPAGWHGVLGGNCVLEPCRSGQCGSGKVCVEHAVCLQPKQDDFYDWGEAPPPDAGTPADAGGSGTPSPSDPLGEPMGPRVRRATPIFRYEAVNLCSASVPCAPPSTCQTEPLCVAPSTRAVAYLGKNIQPVRVARQTDTPLAADGAKPTENAAPASGCGCSVGARTDHGWLVAAAVLVAGAVGARRRRPRRRHARPD